MGPILTASGLIFIGGTDDARFRAFDSKTGKLLWTYKLDYSATDTPITYLGKNGKQYVAVVATGGTVIYAPPGGDSLVVFALYNGNYQTQPRALKPRAARASP
jgi:quinoprotein glucose dehydrogenase